MLGPSGTRTRAQRARQLAGVGLGALALVVTQLPVAPNASADEGVAYVRTFESSGNAVLHESDAVTSDPQGNVFVADTAVHRVVEFNPDGQYLREFGGGSSATAGTDGHLYYPEGIEAGRTDILVADTGGNDVQIFDLSGNFVERWSSQGQLQFNTPDGVAIGCSGHVYVANSRGAGGAGDVVEVNNSGSLVREFGHANLAVPVGIAVEASDNNGTCAVDHILVADEYNGRIAEFNPDGTFTRYIGTQGSGEMQFDHPDQLALDPQPGGGWLLFVAESGNFRVQALSDSGDDNWSSVGIIDQGPNGHLNDTHGVAVDQVGHIFVAQTEDAHVFEYQVESPRLNLRFQTLNKSYTKTTSSLRFGVRYNLLDNTCNVVVKATVTVPPNAAHVFTAEQQAPGVGTDESTVKVNLSSRQLKWMEQAWQAGHNIPISAKASGLCNGNARVSASAKGTIKH